MNGIKALSFLVIRNFTMLISTIGQMKDPVLHLFRCLKWFVYFALRIILCWKYYFYIIWAAEKRAGRRLEVKTARSHHVCLLFSSRSLLLTTAGFCSQSPIISHPSQNIQVMEIRTQNKKFIRKGHCCLLRIWLRIWSWENLIGKPWSLA